MAYRPRSSTARGNGACSAGWATRRTWPTSWCSCVVRRRVTSPALSYRWTAGTRSEAETGGDREGMAFKHIALDVDEKVATLRLNRPPENLLDIAMMEEINEALFSLRGDTLEVLVVRGTDGNFCE